jgi:hypothetical protein
VFPEAETTQTPEYHAIHISDELDSIEQGA